jgi:hypothetical protein
VLRFNLVVQLDGDTAAVVSNMDSPDTPVPARLVAKAMGAVVASMVQHANRMVEHIAREHGQEAADAFMDAFKAACSAGDAIVEECKFSTSERTKPDEA